MHLLIDGDIWVDGFSLNKRMWNGIHNKCKKCVAEYKLRMGLNSRKNRPNKWKDNLSQQYRRAKEGNITWLKK